MLNIGDKAPEFKLKNQDGEEVTLNKYHGKKVIIYFYPKDDTPGCTTESIGFSEKKDVFKKQNTVILGVSADSVESHVKFCNKHNLKVELLSDPEKNMISEYGAWQEKSMYGKKYMGIARSTYLIDENGVIQNYWPKVKVNGHVDAVLEAITSKN